jgi:hypothetical protein
LLSLGCCAVRDFCSRCQTFVWQVCEYLLAREFLRCVRVLVGAWHGVWLARLLRVLTTVVFGNCLMAALSRGWLCFKG